MATAQDLSSACFARSQGLSDGVESSERRDPPVEWVAPPIADTLWRIGGLDEILRRADAFLDVSHTGRGAPRPLEPRYRRAG